MAAKKAPSNEPNERPMGIAGYFVSEAFRRLWVQKRTSLVAVGMIAIALTTLGGFLLVAENLNHAIDVWQGQSRLTIYFVSDPEPEQVESVRRLLANREGFGLHTLVTKDEAWKKFSTHFSQLSSVLDNLDHNPFPPSFEVEVTRETITSPGFDDVLGEIREIDGVDDIQLDWQWVARLRRVAHILNLFGLLAGGTLAVAAAFTIANVIRLTLLLAREEIDIMRLVGATESTIRGPFLLEGMLQGLLGGVASLAILFGAWTAGRYLVGESTTSIVWSFLFSTFLPASKALTLVGAGILAGLVGSWMSLRETSEEAPVTA
jgi:cell division transport system permease protein